LSGIRFFDQAAVEICKLLRFEVSEACKFILGFPRIERRDSIVALEVPMRPKERWETGQSDLLRSRLDAILDMDHALVKLSRRIDWSFLEQRFGAVYEDKPGGRRCRRG
jgi:hypothetical protein